MNGAEKNHVPIIRELIAVSGKPGVELRGQHGVVFKNQNARPRCGASLLNRGQMSAQTAIGARIIIPKTWDSQLPAVRRRKTNYAFEFVFGKLGLHLPPTIWSLVQVDANLVGKEIVKLHEFFSFLSRRPPSTSGASARCYLNKFRSRTNSCHAPRVCFMSSVGELGQTVRCPHASRPRARTTGLIVF